MKNALKIFFKIIDIVSSVISGACAAAFFLLIIYQVICRSFLHIDANWTDEVCRYMFFVMVMAGAILCTKENGHFSIDAASTFLGEKAKKILTLVIDVLSCAFLVFLARSGWLLAQRAAAQSSNMLDIPMRLIYSVIPVCAAIMVIYVVRNLVLHIAALRSTDTDGKES